MATRTGRQVAPLAAALLVLLTACAQLATTTAGAAATTDETSAAASPGPLTSNTLPAANTMAPTTTSVSTLAQPSGTPTPAAKESSNAPVTSGAGEAVVPLPSCRADTLPTAVRGTLTFALSNRAGAPWVIGNPVHGGGYEAAVGAAVAHQLGFGALNVAWKTADPAQVQAAKVAGADVGLGEFRTPDQGGGPVDYSTGYFSISDSVVARAGTPAARVTGLTAMKDLRVASSSETSGAGRMTPARTTYPNAAAALAALRHGAVDAAVVPTPLAVTAGSDIAVVGQLSLPTEQPAQFGMVLPKQSPLTACVSAAIDQLRVTGALAALVQRWVPAANRPLN